MRIPSVAGRSPVRKISRGRFVARCVICKMTLAKSSPSFKSPHSNTPRDCEPTYGRINKTPSMNINHAYRWTHVISLVETVLGITKLLSSGNETLRWMDIGCGTRNFVNNVNPRGFGVQEWDIVGCARQEGKIEVANRQKARGRSFFTADAFDMLGNYKTRGDSFHLVSMFEFLDHLDDPLRFISQLDTFSPKFVLAASPLEQKMKNPRH